MATAAYNVTVKIDGDAVAFTNEPTTNTDPGTYKVYRINTAVRRVLDPGVAITVEVDADGGGAGAYAVAAADTYEIDPLFGIVTFASAQPSVALVRVSGSYLPLVAVGGARSIQIEASATLEDSSELGVAYRKRTGTLKDWSATIEKFEPHLYDNDSGAGTEKIQDKYDNQTPVFVECVHETGYAFRGWAIIESIGTNGSVDGLVEFPVVFQGAARSFTNQTEGAAFGWGAV